MSQIPYRDVYNARMAHSGLTVQETVLNARIRDFKKYLRESTAALDLYVYMTNEKFRGAIQTNKQDPSKLTMRLLVELDSPLHPGSIITWDEEQWIIVQKDRIPNQGYSGFYIVRCNYHIKWVNTMGQVEDSPVFLFSSRDAKVNENLRMWHSLVSPQPNKNLIIIMPERPFDKYTNIIIKQERWFVIETDVASTPGILYASLGEDKLNPIYDDLENGLADTNRIVGYRLMIPDEPIEVKSGVVVTPNFAIFKDGQIVDDLFAVEYTVEGNLIINEDNEIISTDYGEGIITIIIPELSLEERQFVFIVDEPTHIAGIIQGNDSIKLDRASNYSLVVSSQTTPILEDCYISDTTLAQVSDIGINSCIVKANGQNRLGNVILTMVYNNTKYTKNIRIIPLW